MLVRTYPRGPSVKLGIFTVLRAPKARVPEDKMWKAPGLLGLALETHSITSIHSHLHIQTHTHTPHQKGSQRDPEPEPACQLWHYGSQPEAEEDPLHPEHTGPPRAPHPEHCASAPTWSRRGCAKARPWMALAGLQALSCPCQAGSCPCLTLLSGSTSRQPSGVWPSLSLLAATSHSALGGCQL